MKSKFLAVLASGIVLSCVAIVAAQEGPKLGYNPQEFKPPEFKGPPHAAAEPGKTTGPVPAAFTGGNFGWIASNGSWDGRGRFVEILGSNFYATNARQYAEDDSFCYYQESPASSRLWALGKNPIPVTFILVDTTGTGQNFQTFAVGQKHNRVGGP